MALRPGDPIGAGEPLATMYAADEGLLDDGEARLLAAVTIAAEAPAPEPLFSEPEA
jgi:pyrimidine-nucleoside phosphorylase